VTIADTATEQIQDLLPVTRTIIEGPYFRIGAPERDSMIEPGITGDKMLLTGRVLNPEGKPIPGAVLDFWMSDDEGNYDMVGYKLHAITRADSEGRYKMESIVPACYEPRHAKHIHVKVQGISRPLTTQLYFSDDEERLKDNWYYPDLDVQVSDNPNGDGFIGEFDFVIAQVTEKENVTQESLAARVK
jgi:protocatechuate 3,4-dioxygenase beta subunit